MTGANVEHQEFYVYEFVFKDGAKAEVRTVIHTAECVWCQHGQGHRQNAGMRLGLARWHGPFDRLAAAVAHAGSIVEPAPCKRCRPY